MLLIKILLLEDDPDDASIIKLTLAKSPYFKTRIELVSERESFIRALETNKPDIILADYNLPQFSGLEALQLALEGYPQLPFVFVTAAIGEELAAETVLNGARGFVLKSHLHRLNQVIMDIFNQGDLNTQLLSLFSTSSRIQEQIDKNNAIIQKARKLVGSKKGNEIQRENKDLIREELKRSKSEIEKLMKDLDAP